MKGCSIVSIKEGMSTILITNLFICLFIKFINCLIPESLGSSKVTLYNFVNRYNHQFYITNCLSQFPVLLVAVKTAS